MRSSQTAFILFLLVGTSFFTAYGQIASRHDKSDVVYANACLCGLSHDMLDKLQAFLAQDQEDPASSVAKDAHSAGAPSDGKGLPVSNSHGQAAPTNSSSVGGGGTGETAAPTISPQAVSNATVGSNPDLTSLADQLQKLQTQIAAMQRPPNSGNTTVVSGQSTSDNTDDANGDDEEAAERLPIGADLTGLVDSLGTDDTASKLGDSTKANSSTIESALQSTVPQMVSNLFSNIQNLVGSNQSAKSGANSSAPANVLVSIDGSKANIKGNSTDQMSSEGEKLFSQWIDHYLDTLHVTASTANHIRKSAIYLFNKIMKQYISGVSKMSGNLEANMQKCVQAALRDTQVCTSYLLKNYLNFSAGIMRIIGDQVSRIGKRLDNTGTKLATIDLNPFDIVSDVIDSLPNPSSLSNYFRRIGKFLTGESPDDDASKTNQPIALTNNSDPTTTTTTQVPVTVATTQQQQSQPTQQIPASSTTTTTTTSKPIAALENTISNIGKSFFGWMG